MNFGGSYNNPFNVPFFTNSQPSTPPAPPPAQISNSSSVPKVVNTISVGNNPNGISSDGTYVWVTNDSDNTVSQIQCSTGNVINTISVGSNPNQISSDGTNVWVANNNDDTVSQIQCSSSSVVNTISVIHCQGISSDGTNVWAASNSGNSISQIQCSSGNVVNNISVGNSPQCISSDGTNVWVANRVDNTVSQIQCSTGNVINTITVGGSPNGISSDGTNVWVTNYGSNNISQIQCSTGNVVNTISVASQPLGISSDGTNVWVVISSNNSLVQIKCSTGNVVNTISIGNNPAFVSSDGTNVWVTNSGDNTVSQILINSYVPPPVQIVVAPPPTNYILNLTNCMTLWSGTSPSNVQQFIWNPTGNQSQSTNGPGIPNLVPNPSFVSTAGKGGNSWISTGFTLAKGEFIGNSDGSLYLIMNSDGNLNLCTTNYSYYSGIPLPGGNYGGGPNSNAIYQLSEVGQTSMLNNIYYIDADANAHLYPIQNITQSNNYTLFPNLDTPGNDLGPSNSTLEQCQKICDNNNSCSGFVFDSTNNTCWPKNSNMWPYSGDQVYYNPNVNNPNAYPGNRNIYLKMNQITNPPSGISSSTVNSDSYTAKNYVQSPNSPNDVYGLLGEISGDLELLSSLESQIESLANQLIQSNVQLATSQRDVYKQSIKDRKAVDNFFKDYKKIQHEIKNVNTQNRILEDTDIVVLQENYKYLLWTILAIGIVVVTINIFKKNQ